MKGIQGLIVALVFGLAGAVLNHYYLYTEAQNIKKVAFIGLKHDTIVGRGERLTEDNFEKVELPKNQVGNLAQYAFLWDELSSVKDVSCWRTLTDECLLMRSDIKAPPPELELGKDETAMWIPVDARAFVPSLVMPGDMVSFKVPPAPLPALAATLKTPIGGDVGIQPKPEEGEPPLPALPSGPDDPIGPFKVLSIGNRLGSAAVMQAAKLPQQQENVLTIRVSKTVPGEADRAEKLWHRLQAVNFRQVGIILHGKK